MKITGIIWLKDVVNKLGFKHHVETYEVEEVFENKPLFRFIERGDIEGENLHAAFGRTDAGRYLTVYFIHKTTHEALVISALRTKLLNPFSWVIPECFYRESISFRPVDAR